MTVRNQRSRWGSCSRRGTISLNWRLVQTPDLVRDYIIHHELMHLREMNHSARFWARVEEVCPGWREAERWLKRNEVCSWACESCGLHTGENDSIQRNSIRPAICTKGNFLEQPS